MKFLLSSLLLASFCTLSSWSVSSGTPVLIQTPQVSVMEGDNVNISCCWRGEFERGTVSWWKNQTRVRSQLFDFNITQESLQKTSDCSYLIFSYITKAHSGRYTCELSVEIPKYAWVSGSGTELTVTEDQMEGQPSRTDPTIIALGVVAPLLVISLLCFCTLKRKQAKAARVIYEVPHFDSEVAEVDKHSTSSSRGSSQWCQVPVYESFDYFERVQNKGSG